MNKETLEMLFKQHETLARKEPTKQREKHIETLRDWILLVEHTLRKKDKEKSA